MQNFGYRYNFLKQLKAPSRQTLKEFFQPPLHLPRRRHFPFQPASGCRENYGRVSENLKVTQAFCGSEIPPCSPPRADLKEPVSNVYPFSSHCHRDRDLVDHRPVDQIRGSS